MSQRATVYSKEFCPKCEQAKNLLNSKGILFDEIKMERDMDRDTFLATLTEKIGRAPREVPQIFLDDTYIGGADQLVAHFNAG